MGRYRTKVERPTHDPYLGRLDPGGTVSCDEEMARRKQEAGLLGDEVEEPGGLEDLTDKKLREMASDAGIKGRSKMDKDELIEALKDA